ncbi:MAG: hypothetical protein DHS20C01_17780 [marine bacterium B5-7]|nr:MAG: hypothetical protein DHS20C01_17780 [marine bacterium B5-7]
MNTPRVLLIACGALANELVRVKRLNGWDHVDIKCLPAELHNRPERIADAVERKILENNQDYDRIVIGYADCGTGGALDALAERYGASRLAGAHCYQFFAGESKFSQMSDSEPGTFYLTDYLARNFDRLIVQGMGIDRHPEIKEMMFGNYRKLVYLAQTMDPNLELAARQAADYLGLDYEYHSTGLEPFKITVAAHAAAT